MAHLLKFRRTHIPTGSVSVGKFNASHHPVFADPDGFSLREQRSAANRVIRVWNTWTPDIWHYGLLENSSD